ncbi:glycerophosphodiester phosphodiesterase family protein [Mangrovicoccus ximenensis]|uniref:glycerophosphodiester phosphodiesterase family protein n=1 Tax=Mangrovicoccus ximenensis TaxID=1911570 RepID=UPI000D371708
MTAKTLMLAAFAATTALPALAASFNTLTGDAPLVIAHRGASGYLPEHTLAAYELAIQMGADIVEPDVGTTADGQLVVMHDDSLARTTNVEELFAPRNGGYALADFTLAEIKTLTVEPYATASETYPGFVPSMADPYRVPTFNEFLDWVSDYNDANGTTIGVYPESKPPSTPAQNAGIVAAMNFHGFTGADQNSYIQTFDHLAAFEIAELEGLLGMEVPVAALGYATETADGYAVYDYINGSATTLEAMEGRLGGVGVSLGSPGLTSEFVAAAHALGLEVHAWTFNTMDPEAARAQYLEYIAMGLDGIFSNYPDLAVAAVREYADMAPVPLPAALPVLLAGLGALGAGRSAAPASVRAA